MRSKGGHSSVFWFSGAPRFYLPGSSGNLAGMRIPVEIDRERDVAYIPLATHDTLRRVWRSLPLGRNLVLDIDRDGDLVGLELLHAQAQLKRLGIRLA